MGRMCSEAWSMIHSICDMEEVKEKQLYEKAKLLLSIYRKVCWSTLNRANLVKDELYSYCGSDLAGALIYLEEFAPEREKEKFESRVKRLFETKWIIELVDTAMLKVYEFPVNGAMYHEIISKSYLTKFKYTESEMLELLSMERSRFYDHKKEAIMIFGLAFWKTAIPEFQMNMGLMEDER